MSVVAVGRDSGRGFRHDDTIEVSVPAGEAPGWRALTREFELPSGVTQARVVVRDVTSGAMGSVSQRFEVPTGGIFRLATPIITDRIEPAPDAQGAPQPALAVHRVFPSGGGLYVQFEVFGASRDPRQGAPRVNAGLEVWASGNRLARRVEPSLDRRRPRRTRRPQGRDLAGGTGGRALRRRPGRARRGERRPPQAPRVVHARHGRDLALKSSKAPDSLRRLAGGG